MLCAAAIFAIVIPPGALVAQPGKEPEKVALAVGISMYQDDLGLGKLPFANRDAQHFGEHASSGKGGNIVAPALSLLTDGRASYTVFLASLKAALRNAKAGSEVYIFISGRGLSAPGWNEGYIYASDSREEKRSSALRVSDLQQWIEESRAGRVFLFADVQRPFAKATGPAVENRINLRLEDLRHVHGPTVEGLLATGEEDPAVHYGVFSSNLFKALQGQAPDTANANRATFASVWNYLKSHSGNAKDANSGPYLFGNTRGGGNLVLSDLTKPGFTIRAGFRRLSRELAFFQAPGQTLPGSLQEQFDQALAAGRLQGAGSAEEMAQQLGSRLPVPWRASLALALEDRGQQVIMRYGTGDQFPVDETRRDLLTMKREEFIRARDEFRSARAWRDSGAGGTEQDRAFLEAREFLCDGQSKLFDPAGLQSAATSFENALKLTPRFAEAHNARGVAALRSGDYRKALQSFRKASSFEPDWAYPRHNAALAEIELGEYRAAEQDYREAISRTPYYPYLYYNLGLLLHRLNRRAAAEAQYKLALASFEEQIGKYEAASGQWNEQGNAKESVAAHQNAEQFRQNEAEVYNALGLLHASLGQDPSPDYRRASSLNKSFPVAWHNWAVYLDGAGNRVQAIAYWRRAIALDEGFFPSRLKLANALLETGDPRAAEAQFREVLKRNGTNREARIGLVRSLALFDLAEAFREAESADKVDEFQSRPDFQKTLGDLYLARKSNRGACARYRRARSILKRAVWAGTPEDLQDLQRKARACPAER